MNSKKEQQLILFLFVTFLAGMALLYLCLPKDDFSSREKRYLAEKPFLSWESLSEGDFSEDVETYMADHIPGRNFFVGLNAYFDLLTGRQGSKDILLTKDKRLVEAPVVWDEVAVQKNMKAINSFAENTNIPIDLMIIPSAGWAAQKHAYGGTGHYEDETIIRSIYALAADEINTADISSVFSQTDMPEQYYYKTDHHWTSLGAYTACRNYIEQMGGTYPEADAFSVESIDGFYGSTYSRSALWLTPGEEIQLWHGGENISVMHDALEQPHDSIFFRQRLEEEDKYTVFLDGNHPIVRVRNEDNAGKGKLLVIRDSYSNCLGGFLAEAYEEVVLVDLRYYRQPVSQLLEENFERVLISYSIGNFLSDTNIIWLR